jgi:hypothetical protein
MSVRAKGDWRCDMSADGNLLPNPGVAALSVALVSLLVAAADPAAQSTVGLLGVLLVGLSLIAAFVATAASWPEGSNRIRVSMERCSATAGWLPTIDR